MLKYTNIFERIIITLLSLMMALVIFLSTIELGWIIIKSIVTAPIFFLDITKLVGIFELFLLILIGIELLASLKAYVTETVIRVEVVLLVGMIAIARKVIVLDIKEFSDPPLLGIGAITIALAAGYYLIRQSQGTKRNGSL